MKRVFLTLLIALCWAKTSAAEQTLELTLTRAIDIALSENPTIKIADLEVARYDYVRKATMGGLLPQLAVNSQFNQTLKNQSMAKGFSFGGEHYLTSTTSADLSLALYTPAVYRTLKMNASEAQAAVETARASRIDLVAAVKDSFYGVMLAERSLEVLESSAQTAKETVDETQIKYDNGLSSEYDLLTAQVQYSNLQPSIMQTRASIEVAKDLLKMYLSIPQSVDVEIMGDFDKIRESILNLSSNMSRDISGNSSLKSLALSQEILSHQLRINNASRLPSLSAYGKVTYTGNNMESFSFGSSGENKVPEPREFFWQTPASVGLNLSIPIFSGLSKSARSHQIENQIEQMELQRLYAEDSVNVSLSTAISDIYTARETYLAQQQTVSQASKSYEISLTRYNSGTGTILELNTSRLALTQAELNLSQAVYDLLVARSEYDKIVGAEF